MERLPVEGKIYRGEVKRIEPFGAFVELPEFSVTGLAHISQLSQTRVETPADVVTVGDLIYVKVLSIESQDNRKKISLSMKYCDQSTGEDRDKNGLNSEYENRRRQPQYSDPAPLELGAILNTVCGRCGGKGHLQSECFNTKGTKYELIPLDDEPPRSNPRNNPRTTLPSSGGLGRGRAATLPAWMTSGEHGTPKGLGGGILLSSDRQEDRDKPKSGRDDRRGNRESRHRPSPARERSQSPRRHKRHSPDGKSLPRRSEKEMRSPERQQRDHRRRSVSREVDLGRAREGGRGRSRSARSQDRREKKRRRSVSSSRSISPSRSRSRSVSSESEGSRRRDKSKKRKKEKKKHHRHRSKKRRGHSPSRSPSLGHKERKEQGGGEEEEAGGHRHHHHHGGKKTKRKHSERSRSRSLSRNRHHSSSRSHVSSFVRERGAGGSHRSDGGGGGR